MPTMSSAEWSMITVLFILLVSFPSSNFSLETITPNQPIKDGDVLVSSRKIFALGFFSPGNSKNRYVGVWFNQVAEQTIVWVANRDNPVSDTSGLLAINPSHGGLVIYGKDRNTPIWSANVTALSSSSSSSPDNSITAKLLDTGNLVLLENGSQRVVWQGFDYPSNTVIPSMKIGLDRRSGLNRFLTSWKSGNDPGLGNCTYGIDPSGFPQLIVHKGLVPWWRAGPWTGKRWSGVPEFISDNAVNYLSFVNNQDEVFAVYSKYNDSIFTRAVIDESGILQRLIWHDQDHRWIELSSNPSDWCDNYGQCGPNSNCDSYSGHNFSCVCLPGFEPKSPGDWLLRVGSGGCVRRRAGVSTCGNGEGFVKLSRVKVPDTSTARVNLSLSLEACEQECLKNCSCIAYTSADERNGGMGCLTWHGDLMDTRTFSSFGQDLYVRVDAVVLAEYAKPRGSVSRKERLLAISIGSAFVLLLLVSLLYWLARRKRKGKRRRQIERNEMKSDLPFFHLMSVEAATNNFSDANKLGEGGFGSVYKGVLYDGKEIAVKRLSKNSSQGIQEFKNEVALIAKLQHRNLVKILGCCVQDEERMLIYEYVPNKSLDSFIFGDESKRALLDWTRRFEIIYGIARGILYLHEDSRLRIIHRDLKASNVLLDASLNPKIADFGMARIFRGDQSVANTNRVVGTYGYMSPEYAMEGLFSVKSDVYSFGVLLLEIVTGRKNGGYYNEKYPDSNLVGHVWDLWREDNALEIVDSSLGESYPVKEVVRCIQIAFLCVQEYATDRPTMSAVVFMLGNSDAALPSPGRPAFLLKRVHVSEDPSTPGGVDSVNFVTCTMVEAR